MADFKYILRYFDKRVIKLDPEEAQKLMAAKIVGSDVVALGDKVLSTNFLSLLDEATDGLADAPTNPILLFEASENKKYLEKAFPGGIFAPKELLAFAKKNNLRLQSGD